jgi:diadenosine tetraphosphatase ApaH/serine/threonine PP2A family protein phosphatase
MRTLIVADVHGNIEALEAVLRDAESSGSLDAIWCLGDTAGYGAEPGACIDLLRSFPLVAIAGNHDLAAAGLLGTEDFNPAASTAAEWTAAQLKDEQRAWLASLPASHTEGDFSLVHGSFVDPVWDYLVSEEAARDHFELQETPYCLVGHSHYPLVFAGTNGAVSGFQLQAGDVLLLESVKFVANPGSVGQPRDGDPRAAYALLDHERHELSFHRVEYDFRSTQGKIIAAGLPPFLAERLELGH